MSAAVSTRAWARPAAWTVFGLAALLPWLGFLVSPRTVLADAFATIPVALGALAGFGAVLAFALRRRDAGLGELWALGLAAYLLVGGVLTAAGRFTIEAQIAQLAAGLVMLVLSMALRRREVVGAIEASLRCIDVPIVIVAFVLVAVTVLHLIGLASAQHAPTFDDDGNWVAAVKRLRDLGGFGDVVGYPRANQVGGSVVAAGLVAPVDEVRASRLAEGLGFLMLIVLLARLALPARGDASLPVRRGQGTMVFILLVLALSAKAQAEQELWAFWLPAFLLVASYRVLALEGPWTRARAIELGLLVGAMVTFRFEYLPFALAMIAVSVHDADGRLERTWLGASLLALVPVLAPLAIDRYVERGHGTAVTKLLIQAIPLVVLLALAAWSDRRGSRRSLPRFGWAIAIGSLFMYLGPTRAGGYSARFVWTLLFPFGFVLAAELARAQWAPRLKAFRFRHYAAPLIVMLSLWSVMRAQDLTVRANWKSRIRKWMTNARLANAVPELRGIEPYARLTAALPPDEPVLAWVDRPELLDFSERPIFDLRTPRLRGLRRFAWDHAGSPLVSIRNQTGARYLLFQTDRLRDKRARDSQWYALWCNPFRPDSVDSPYVQRPVECADPLEHALLGHQVEHVSGNVYLIDLDEPASALSRLTLPPPVSR